MQKHRVSLACNSVMQFSEVANHVLVYVGLKQHTSLLSLLTWISAAIVLLLRCRSGIFCLLCLKLIDALAC